MRYLKTFYSKDFFFNKEASTKIKLFLKNFKQYFSSKISMCMDKFSNDYIVQFLAFGSAGLALRLNTNRHLVINEQLC